MGLPYDVDNAFGLETGVVGFKLLKQVLHTIVGV